MLWALEARGVSPLLVMDSGYHVTFVTIAAHTGGCVHTQKRVFKLPSTTDLMYVAIGVI